jgi:hypothetical protein
LGDRSILVFLPNLQPVLFQGSDSLWDASRRLPTLPEIELELTGGSRVWMAQNGRLAVLLSVLRHYFEEYYGRNDHLLEFMNLALLEKF